MKTPQDTLVEINKLILWKHKRNVKTNLENKFGGFVFSDIKIYYNRR